MAFGFRRKAVALAAALIACTGVFAMPSAALAAEGTYEIYPTPHEIRNTSGEQTLRTNAVAVIEEGIDADTVARLDEALALKNVTYKKADAVPATKSATAVLVGIKGSGGVVDKQVDKLVKEGKLEYKTDDLFSKTDAYLLASVPSDGKSPDQIIVLGRDTDSAFYGLTSLYQIFQQVDGAKLRGMVIEDYADVITRGFIEGYYGNPWSTEDRVELMRWGGYYKLNAYFYAPKDDPKHNKDWKAPYTADEIKTLITPLAEAGNKSKVRFVYALHPFMHNPISNGNYDETFPIMKEKFLQVIDAGVRQISILADDAGDQGAPLYTRLLKDTTEWLRELQKMKNADGTLKYPGLKDTLIFCPKNYMGNGEGWYKDLPSNVQVINTGGTVWGKIDKNFAETFKRTSGVEPFMWINWPCSDNDKDALHMGGHNNFLGAGLKSGQVKGIVINPMQQSEPSKQGIFMNADFTWNFWETTQQSDALWEKSFSYIDHNSGAETKGSVALRELSRHMQRMYGGGTTWENGESSAIKDQLNEFRTKLTAGTVAPSDCDGMTAIFEKIQADARMFRTNAGTERMLKQMDPFVSTWEDLTRAAIEGIAALKADLEGDPSGLLAHYTEAAAAFDSANGHGYNYIDHTEYARVGKAHITPTVQTLIEDVAIRATIAADPDADVTKVVTSRQDVPAGKISNLLDGDPLTGVSYKNPDRIEKDTYIGIQKNRPFNLDRFTITYDEKHLNDTIRNGKLQVLEADKDGEKTWVDVADKAVTSNKDKIVDFKGINKTDVYGVRIIATADNGGGCWLTVNELEINKVDAPAPEEGGPVSGTPAIDKMVIADNAANEHKDLNNVADGNKGTAVHFRRVNDNGNGERDHMPAGATLRLDFDEPQQINSIYFKQEESGADRGDGISEGKVQYLPVTAAKAGAGDGWVDAGAVNSASEQTINLPKPVMARAIRVVNGADTQRWWKIFEFQASLEKNTFETITGIVTLENQVNADSSRPLQNASDAKDSTEARFKSASGDKTDANATITVTFPATKEIDAIVFKQDARSDGGDMVDTAEVSYKGTDGQWHKVGEAVAKHNQIFEIGQTVEASAIRVVNKAEKRVWWRVVDLYATRGELPEAPAANPTASTNLGTYENNPIGNVIDGDESTRFYSNAGTNTNSWIMYSFGSSKRIDTVRMLQGANDRFNGANVFYTADESPNADGGSWTKLGEFGVEPDQTLEFDPIQATAIKIQAKNDNSNWLQVFEIEAYERYAFSADNIKATFKADLNLKARVGRGAATVEGGQVVLPNAGDVVSVDLGNIRRDVKVKAPITAANTELVYSKNAVEWIKFEGDGAVEARYVGYRAKANGTNINLNGFTLSYLNSLAPSMLDSTLAGVDALDVKKVFDGDVRSSTKNSGEPAEGNVLLFDLGQERTITKLEYFVPETSNDFIRNAVIEVAQTADAQDDAWTKVVDINSAGEDIAGAGKDNVAKDYGALTHSSKFPGNMFAASPEGTNMTGRYLRIRFTKAFADRSVEIGELRINDGEYATSYVDADFKTTTTEQPGKLPGNMFDKNLNSTWAPQGEAAGDVTYQVSEPLHADGSPIQGIRIISRGTPGNARVTAEVYVDDTYSTTSEIELGAIGQNSQEFRFAPAATRAASGFQAVKNVKIAWGQNAAPQIAEIYLLAEAPAAQSVDVDALKAKVAEAKAAKTEMWTANSVAKLNQAVSTAEAALAKPQTLTTSAANSLVKQIDSALKGFAVKYAGTELADLVAKAPSNGKLYTERSWIAYQDALNAAKKALENADNLEQSAGEALAESLRQAQDGLVPSTATAERAAQMVEDARDLYGTGSHTTDSRAAFDAALKNLSDMIAAGEKDPSKLQAAMDALSAAQAGLVDTTALIAERAEFEKTNESAYTAESYGAYKKAYDDSTALLESGTVDEVAAAVKALQDARAALVANNLDSLIAEAEKLSEADYTEASWSVFSDALAAAKAGRNDANASELARALSQARSGLVNVVALKDAIARASSIDTSRFTADSVARLTAAVNAAAPQLKNGSNESVEAARQAILTAIDGLAPVAPGEGSGSTSKPAKPGTSGKPGSALPSTGDDSMVPIAIAGVAGIAAVAAGAVIAKRRRA